MEYRFPLFADKEFLLTALLVLFSIAFILIGSWQAAILLYFFLSGPKFINKRFNLVIYFLILFVPITRFPGLGEYIEVIRYLIFSVVLFFWAAKKHRNDFIRFRDNPVTPFFIAFFFMMLLNLILSIDRAASLKAAFSHCLAFGYFYLFLDFFDRRKFIKEAVLLLILTAVLLSGMAILQYLEVNYKVLPFLEKFILPSNQQYNLVFNAAIFNPPPYRSVATFYHANLLGIYLSMVLPLNLCFIFLVRGLFKKLVLSFSVFIVLIGIFYSGSRGAFVSIATSGIFLLIVFWKRIPKAMFLASCISIGLFYLIFQEQVAKFFRIELILSFRDLIWKNAFDLIREKPLFGWGLGAFHQIFTDRFAFPSLTDFQIILNEMTIDGRSELLQGFHAHNLFLNYAAEMGIFALVLLCYFYFIYLKNTMWVFKSNLRFDFFDYTLIIGVISVILGSIVHSFFETTTNFYYLPIAIPFSFIAALGMNLVLRYAKKNPNQSSFPLDKGRNLNREFES